MVPKWHIGAIWGHRMPMGGGTTGGHKGPLGCHSWPLGCHSNVIGSHRMANGGHRTVKGSLGKNGVIGYCLWAQGGFNGSVRGL